MSLDHECHVNADELLILLGTMKSGQASRAKVRNVGDGWVASVASDSDMPKVPKSPGTGLKGLDL